MRATFAFCSYVLAAAIIAGQAPAAAADPPTPAPASGVMTAPAAAAANPHHSPPAGEPMQAARFSGKRLVIEMLAGAAVGSIAAYATFEVLCSGTDCFGASLAGAAVNFAITPLAVWGTGRWAGGQGTVGMTYLGGSVAFAAFSVPGQPNEAPSDTLNRVKIELAISTLVLPVTSAAFFELSSHLGYERWRSAAAAGNLAFGVVPTYDRHGMAGAMGQLSLRF
jgi:hypothetical protein